MNRTPLLVILVALTLLPGALATVDLINPADNLITNQSGFSFEYYASVPGFTGCDLRIGDNTFPDPDAQTNAMNEVTVANILPGIYRWNVTCVGGNMSEAGSTRTLTIDDQAPTLAVASPVNGATLQTVAYDAIPNDGQSPSLTCTASWNGQELARASVAANTHFTGNHTVPAGNGTLVLACQDAAGNTAAQERQLTIRPQLHLRLMTDRPQYGIGEQVRLTIDTLPGANLTVDICPNQPGFVQCGTALIDTSTFPQTITLPYVNRTGEYLIEAVARYDGQTRTNRTTYRVDNTISIGTKVTGRLRTNSTILLSATPAGGIAPYRIAWRLSNGTTLADISSVQMRYLDAGSYRENVTVTDAANNTRSEALNITITGTSTLSIRVVDNATSEPIVGADIELDGEETTTLTGGMATVDVDDGSSELFVSAEGYAYSFQDILVNGSATIEVRLDRVTAGVPDVVVLEPGPDATVQGTTRIRYTVEHDKPVTCTLLLGTPENWFLANGTADVADDTVQEFLRDMPIGEQRIRIECEDTTGKSGTSEVVRFTVGSGLPADPIDTMSLAPTSDDLYLQGQLERLDGLLATIDAYGQREKEAIAILGFDRDLRNAKRAVQQAARDLDSLQYRIELDATAREAERTRIVQGIEDLMAGTPQGITVTDSKTYVRYVTKDTADEVAQELAGLDGMTSDADRLRELLLEDQQRFTVSTKLVQVQYLYANASSSTVTIITRSFTYAEGLEPGYGIIEIIPKTVAKSAKEIRLITQGTVLKDDPVIRFGTEETISYIIPRKVDFTLIEEGSTVLARQYADDPGLLTGFVVFDGIALGGASTPLIIAVAAIILLYLAYYFDLIKQAKYIMYRLGKNERVHYLRVMIRDAADQLDANDYAKAEMLYKEIRLTYDTLPDLARNDLYEDVIDLVRRMDAYYFNLIMLEMDGHLKAGDLASAIDAYERLTGTFERLDQERQEQLIVAVQGMAKRLGLGVRA